MVISFPADKVFGRSVSTLTIVDKGNFESGVNNYDKVTPTPKLSQIEQPRLAQMMTRSATFDRAICQLREPTLLLS